MNIDSNIASYLDRSASFSNSIILLTDNKKIIYNSKYSEDKNHLPHDYIIHMHKMHKQDLVFEVYNKCKFKLLNNRKDHIRNQCIALILDEDKIIGSLIILNHTLDFECKNYVFMSTLLRTIKIMLKNKDTD